MNLFRRHFYLQYSVLRTHFDEIPIQISAEEMTEPEPDQAGVPLVEALIDPDQPNAHDKGSKKRKRDAEGKSQPEEKKSKTRRKLKKPKDVDDSMLDVDRGVNLAIAHMDPQLMAEHVAQRTRRFEPDLTMVEAEERILPGEHVSH